MPVIVITGPSGAGKGTLIRALLSRMPELELAVSATTRLRRKGEEEGRDYYYLSDAEFAHRVARGEFLEHVTYVSGQRYGTLRTEVERIGADGRVAVLELETEGAHKVSDELPNTVTIFVTAPVTELARRLRERATESAGEIGERLDLAENQLRQASLFDHVVENDDVGRAVDELLGIVRRELAAAGTMSAP
jgi:guanylate kinase